MFDLASVKVILNQDNLETGLSIIVLILIVCNFILTLRSKSLEDIRSDVYEAFLRLEEEITGTKVGQQRLEKAVEYAYELIPSWMRIFITKAFLKKTVDKWFKQIKKILDDSRPKDNVVDTEERVNEEVQFEEDCSDDGDL